MNVTVYKCHLHMLLYLAQIISQLKKSCINFYLKCKILNLYLIINHQKEQWKILER